MAIREVKTEVPLKFEWLFQSLAGRLVYGALSFVASAVVGWFRKLGSAWLTPVFYGLGTLTFLAVLFIVGEIQFGVFPAFQHVSPDDIESDLQQWGLNDGFALQSVSDAGAKFRILLTLATGIKIDVVSPKNNERILLFISYQPISPQDQAAYNTLSDADKKAFVNDVTLEIALSKTEFLLKPNSLQVQRVVPVATMSETNFESAIDDVSSAIIVANSAYGAALRKYLHEQP